MEEMIRFLRKTKSGRLRETVIYRGVYYHRYYPDDCYFWGKGGKQSLHRAVWEYHNGPIPPDHDIHHKDENPLNNHISNLECLTKKEHRRRHPFVGAALEKQRKIFSKAREKASLWHRTEEGRKWHSEHAKKIAKELRENPQHVSVCVICKSAFQSVRPNRMYCSNSCSYRAGLKKHRKKRKCIHCESLFLANPGVSSCSKKCAAAYRVANGKQGSQNKVNRN